MIRGVHKVLTQYSQTGVERTDSFRLFLTQSPLVHLYHLHCVVKVNTTEVWKGTRGTGWGWRTDKVSPIPQKVTGEGRCRGLRQESNQIKGKSGPSPTFLLR